MVQSAADFECQYTYVKKLILSASCEPERHMRGGEIYNLNLNMVFSFGFDVTLIVPLYVGLGSETIFGTTLPVCQVLVFLSSLMIQSVNHMGFKGVKALNSR